MVILEIQEKPDSEWNSRLKNSELGTIFHTKEYATYIHSRLKAKPIYLKFYDSDKIVSQLLAFQTYKGSKKISKWFGRGFIYSFASKSSLFPKQIFWTFGPIIFNNNFQNEIYDTLGNFLIKEKLNFNGSSHPLQTEYIFPSKFNFIKEQQSTFIINLNQSLGTIFKKTNKHSVQKNIKRSEERGVTITEINSKQDLVIYYQLQKEYRMKNKMTPYLKNDITEGFSLLQPIGYGGFLAWYNKNPVSGISFSFFNGYINESGIARTNIDTEKNLYSQDLLRWKIIEWGIKNNCRYYDLSGVKSNNRSMKEEGIFRNKKKWGGTQYNYWMFKSDWK